VTEHRVIFGFEFRHFSRLGTTDNPIHTDIQTIGKSYKPALFTESRLAGISTRF